LSGGPLPELYCGAGDDVIGLLGTDDKLKKEIIAPPKLPENLSGNCPCGRAITNLSKALPIIKTAGAGVGRHNHRRRVFKQIYWRFTLGASGHCRSGLDKQR